MGKSKVFVIGLDGASFDLLAPWMQQGKLPNLANILRQGTSGVLQSVIPPITTPAWVSFQTGKNPAKHGLFSWVKREADSYRVAPFNSSNIGAETISSMLSRHGRRVGLINVPCTFPPAPVNGFVVTGLETPNRNSNYTYPEKLAHELIDRFDYEIERTQKYKQGNEDSFIQAVESVEHKRAKAVLYMMDKYEWDFFMTVFRGTDILSHAFWRFTDPEHPRYDAQLAEKYGNVLLNHYQGMDKIVGELAARLDDDTDVIIMSDHGSGPTWRYVYLDNYFIKLGITKLKRSLYTDVRYSLFKMGLTPKNILKLLSALGLRNLSRRLLPGDLRAKINSHMTLNSNIDWSRTKAYTMGGVGQIYINLKWREPQGCVEAGAEYDELTAYIKEQLYKLTDPGTGQKMVKRILDKNELPGGAEGFPTPDLYVEWVNDLYADLGILGYSSELMSEYLTEPSGGHTMRGIFIAKGPSYRQAEQVTNAKITDVLPCILYGLGLPIPDDLDGALLKDAFRPELLAQRPVEYEKTNYKKQDDEYSYSQDERDEVKERLKALGYIA